MFRKYPANLIKTNLKIIDMRLESGVISTACDYYRKLHETNFSDEELEELIDLDETGDKKFEVSIEEFNMVGEIISCQVSFWCLRRISHSCQSNTDIMNRIINKKIKEYKKTFNKEFVNFNEEIIW